jgi:type VI secretion system protein ImpB
MAGDAQREMTLLPRVHIYIDVQTNGGTIKRELPFVLGLFGDYLGDSSPAKSLRDRSFVDISAENFGDVMTKLGVALNLTIPDPITNEMTPIELKFRTLGDFTPDGIIRQDDRLARLREARDKLTDLQAMLDRDEVDELVATILQPTNSTT